MKNEKRQGKTLWQLVMFFLMSGVTTLVDLAVFALCNYLVFAKYSDRAFVWGPFQYDLAAGGLCAFLSFAVSFAISQTVNFFLQRKATFGATNNVLRSAIMYAFMVVLVYLFVLWLPSLIAEPIYALLGAGIGPLAVKVIGQLCSALIQFPINKFVIMRNDGKED